VVKIFELGSAARGFEALGDPHRALMVLNPRHRLFDQMVFGWRRFVLIPVPARAR
jgi:hypothetical protein